MKRCSKCRALKELEAFYRARGNPDGRRPECKACFDARRKRWYLKNRKREIARVRAWQKANPDRVKASRDRNREHRNKQLREIHLRNKFGLTPEEYDAILESQGVVCALCESQPTPGISLHVDHDHGTGEIRGLRPLQQRPRAVPRGSRPPPTRSALRHCRCEASVAAHEVRAARPRAGVRAARSRGDRATFRPCRLARR